MNIKRIQKCIELILIDYGMEDEVAKTSAMSIIALLKTQKKGEKIG